MLTIEERRRRGERRERSRVERLAKVAEYGGGGGEKPWRRERRGRRGEGGGGVWGRGEGRVAGEERGARKKDDIYRSGWVRRCIERYKEGNNVPIELAGGGRKEGDQFERDSEGYREIIGER